MEAFFHFIAGVTLKRYMEAQGRLGSPLSSFDSPNSTYDIKVTNNNQNHDDEDIRVYTNRGYELE